jgi:enamine deaminase RidA (YjgF/YER057c/UK114 family)
MKPEERLTQLGVELPELPDPIGNYVHGVCTGNLLFLSGKVPATATGKVGSEVSIEDAYAHAREVGLYLLAAMKRELGSLDCIRQIVKVGGMVNCDPTFADHPKVVNGCSDLFVEVFGDIGRHARAAVGMGSLPGNVTVEIDAVVEVAQP